MIHRQDSEEVLRHFGIVLLDFFNCFPPSLLAGAIAGTGILRSLTVSVSPRKVRPKLRVAGASDLLFWCLILFLLISVVIYLPLFHCEMLACS